MLIALSALPFLTSLSSPCRLFHFLSFLSLDFTRLCFVPPPTFGGHSSELSKHTSRYLQSSQLHSPFILPQLRVLLSFRIRIPFRLQYSEYAFNRVERHHLTSYLCSLYVRLEQSSAAQSTHSRQPTRTHGLLENTVAITENTVASPSGASL